MSKSQKRLIIILLVAVIAAGALLFRAANNSVTVAPDKPQTRHFTPVPTPPNAGEIFNLVNNERVKAGLPALTDDPRLDNTAATKCQHLLSENYFGHTEPNGTQFFDVIHAGGVIYHYAGENLQFSVNAAPKVVATWMGSPGHRANILNPRYTRAGTAVCHSGSYQGSPDVSLEVQHFIGL